MKIHIKILVFILLFGIGISAGFAQMFYNPYYGKNKVLYSSFNWETYSTDHFDIYFYNKDERTLQGLADMAESAYQTLSRRIKHQLSTPVPLILYQTITDFEQTNLFPISEGILGAAEALLFRVALHGDMPPDELQNLIEHELAHIFEYDILWGGPGGVLYSVSRPPQWVFEGFSEHNTDHWGPFDLLTVRDAVLNDRIPEMNEGGHIYSQYPAIRPIEYTFGHALFDFIEDTYGKNAIGNFWQSLKSAPLLGRVNPIRRAFKKEPKVFGQEFKKYLREKNKQFFLRENPEDYSITLGPEYPMNQYWLAFSLDLSPSGEIVAVQTLNARDFDFDVILVSTKDGKVLKNLTAGYTLKYEYIKFDTNPSYGGNISWSSDGDTLACLARSGERYVVLVLDAMTGKILKKVRIPQDRPMGPRFIPDSNEVLYTAFTRGVHDIYKINLDTGQTVNLSQDEVYEKAPSVSSDGTQLVYTIRVGEYDKVFISPINNLKERTQVTFGEGNTIAPKFSQDGKTIYYSGDMNDAFNIYSVNLESGEMLRYTDVRTGNFFIHPVPAKENSFIFSSFHKGAYQIYKSEFEPELEKTVTFVKNPPESYKSTFKPVLSFEFDKSKVSDYKGLGKLYMLGRPPVDTLFATDGSIYGGSSIAFSDLFNDHQFSISAYQYRTFRSYQFAYLNQKRRLQYMASAYKYTLFYYPLYAYYDPTLFNFYNYQDSIATRSISGVTLAAIYPFSLYYRLEGSMQFSNYDEEYYDLSIYESVQQGQASANYFWNGNTLALSLALTGETTKFKNFGPSKGNTFRVGLTQTVPVSDSWIQNTTLNLDYRHYLNIGGDALFAFRFKGFASRGKNPYISYFGGNNEVRSQYYYSQIGSEGWFANLEFRFPVINIAATVIGVIGPIRGSLFMDIARTKIKGLPAKTWVVEYDDYLGYTYRHVEAVGSWGIGLEFFLMGLPLHLDFVKTLSWDKFSKPFDYHVGNEWKTKFWIGFDF